MACGIVGASADQATLIFDEETVYGVPDGANPPYEQMAYVSESLAQQTGTTTSNEITGERRVQDVSRTNVSAAGDVNFELSYQSAAVATTESLDLLWEAGLQSAVWTTQVQAITAQITISVDSIATAGGGFATIDDSGSGLATYVVNQIVKVIGFTGTPANNAFCKVVTVAAGSLEVIVLNTAGDFVDEAAGDSVTLTQGPYITDGDTCRSFTIEREYTDLASTFEQFVGMTVDGFALAIPTEGIITGSFTFLGSKATNPSPTSTSGDGTPNAPEPNDKMNSIDNVLIVTENNAEFDIVAFGMTGANNSRARQQVGNLGAVSVGAGRLELTGTLQAFFSDSTFFDKYLSFTETSLLVIFQDTATNTYVLDLPAIKLTTGQRVSGGINTDIIADMGWTAKKDATEGIVVRMARFDSADT